MEVQSSAGNGRLNAHRSLWPGRKYSFTQSLPVAVLKASRLLRLCLYRYGMSPSNTCKVLEIKISEGDWLRCIYKIVGSPYQSSDI